MTKELSRIKDWILLRIKFGGEGRHLQDAKDIEWNQQVAGC